MLERLAIRSTEGAGTAIGLSVPGRIAYQNKSAWPRTLIRAAYELAAKFSLVSAASERRIRTPAESVWSISERSWEESAVGLDESETKLRKGVSFSLHHLAGAVSGTRSDRIPSVSNIGREVVAHRVAPAFAGQ